MNPDPDIERVLSALRNAAPQPDMERRLLDALAQRPAAPSFWSSWNLRRLSASAAAFALPAGALVILLLSVVFAHRHPRPTTAHVAASPTTPAPTQPAELHTVVIAQKPHIRTPRHIVRTVPPAAELTAATCHCDPIALTETLAPSRPAPPLPLTTQEKMLRHMVQHGNTVELAQLDPNLRARSNAHERAQFQTFFAPPSTGDKE